MCIEFTENKEQSLPHILRRPSEVDHVVSMAASPLCNVFDQTISETNLDTPTEQSVYSLHTPKQQKRSDESLHTPKAAPVSPANAPEECDNLLPFASFVGELATATPPKRASPSPALFSPSQFLNLSASSKQQRNASAAYEDDVANQLTSTPMCKMPGAVTPSKGESKTAEAEK